MNIKELLKSAWAMIRPWLKRYCPPVFDSLMEAFCWLIIPAGYGYILYLSYRTGHDTTWMQFFLATLALSPWLLRIFARYLSEFSIGPSGVSGKIRESTANQQDVEGLQGEPAPRRAPVGSEPTDEFLSLTPPARKVLGTLWKYQVELFGDKSVSRWGFVVGPKSPEFQPFTLGALELMQKRLALFGPNGFLFLTNQGIEFCTQWNKSVVGQKDHYSNFKGK